MKRFLLILIFFTLGFLLKANNLKISVDINHYKADTDEKQEIKHFTQVLEERFKEYDWEIPHDILTDRQTIDISLSVTIKRELSDNNFQIAFNCYGGLNSDKRVTIPYKKNIYFREKETNIFFDYEEEPELESDNANDIVNVLKFYTYLILGNVYDRLSYVDSEHFKLQGNSFYKKLLEFNSLINSSLIKENWKTRVELIEKYNNSKMDNSRRLEALYFNAKHFFNEGEYSRCKLFIPYLFEHVKQLTKDEKKFFLRSNRINLLKIFLSKNDSTCIIDLRNLEEKRFYRTYDQYLKKIKTN